MLEVFYLDVAKVDPDIAYTNVLQSYLHMFQVFQVFSYARLQIFYLNVTYVCNDFQVFSRRFPQVFPTLISNV